MPPDRIDRVAYPFTSRWMDLPAGRMHYLDEGEGKPLLFVHGTPTWSFEWRHLILALATTHRCIAPDHLGFGLSARPRGFPYTPEAHAQNLMSFVEQLNPPPLTLIVHDYGGPIGLPLCIRQPHRVDRLVLVNTWMWSFVGDRDMERRGRIAGGRLGRFLYRWANLSLRVLTPQAYGDRRKLTPAIHRHYLERFTDPWSRGTVLWPLARAILGSSSFYESLWRERERLRGRPALIIWGMKDPAFPPYQLARWREVLPAARAVELADAGHWPHEEAPDQVIDAVREFLANRGLQPHHPAGARRAGVPGMRGRRSLRSWSVPDVVGALRWARRKGSALRADTYALYLASRDPRVPRLAKALAALTVAYALSPIDLIPDFIPVLGHLDDLVLVPLGLALTIRLVPPPVLDELRVEAARRFAHEGPQRRVGVALVVLTWLLAAAWMTLALWPKARS